MKSIYLLKKLIYINVHTFSILLGLAAATVAEDLRSQFPGRRVGGGTRGECSARFLAHVATTNSTYSPGESGLLAIIQGPSNNHRPITTKFGNYSVNKEILYNYELVLNHPNASLFIFKIPKIVVETSWSSNYKCSDENTNNFGILDFVEEYSPPALSLLLKKDSIEDLPIQKSILKYSKKCDEKAQTEEIFNEFKLGNNIDKKNWPMDLDIICY